MTIRITKPILKWVGGKTQILDSILSLFPEKITNYYEPFLGGGSVLLGLLSFVKAGKISLNGKIYASDINPSLIALYKTIQSNPGGLILELEKLSGEYYGREISGQEEYYYGIRERYNESDRESVSGVAMFLFLNKTGFRGMYREGPRGFNVPFGNYKKPNICDKEHILEISELIQEVEFRNVSFELGLNGLGVGDVVYLDPPYLKEASTSFVSYTADGFDSAKTTKLFQMIHGMESAGAFVLMSNADVKEIREEFLEPKYKIQYVTCRRAINAKQPGSVAREVLVRTGG